jgi:hypothetical protein
LRDQPGGCHALTPRAAGCCAQALIDAPEITRTIINFKRLLLTDLTVEIGKIPNKKTLKEALAAAGACRARLASRAARACSCEATMEPAARRRRERHPRLPSGRLAAAPDPLRRRSALINATAARAQAHRR